MHGRERALAVGIAVLVLAALVGVGVLREGGSSDRRLRATASTTTSTSTTTTSTSTSTTTTSTTTTTTTTTAPPPTEPPTTAAPTTAASTTAASAPSSTAPAGPVVDPGAWGAGPYAGLGTWIDVYDWTAQYGGAQISLADIDNMAAHGVQTLFVQPVRWDSPTPLMETDRLLPLLRRARADGMQVVAWYLPELEDVGSDVGHLMAIAQQLPIDGLAVDLESRAVEDVAERSRRLVDVSDQLRAALPGQVLGAIVLPPVVMEDVNPSYWPGYPWAGLANDYDVWLPMAYFTNRIDGWRDAHLYTSENVSRVRARIGRPDAMVHDIGGIGDKTTPDDVAGMAQACAEQGCIGGSLYDYRTTGDPALWSGLQAFRR